MVCEVNIVSIDDWTRPKDELQCISNNDELILKAIKEAGITYPAEIVGMTGLSRQTIFDRLCFLKTQGIIERVTLGREPPEKMKPRLTYLFEQGIKGKLLKRISWYQLVEHETGKKK